MVEGIPEPAEGKLENWLLRDGRTNTSKVVAAGTKDAKKAVLNYKVLQMKKVASGKVLLENAAGLQHSNDELSEKTTELRQSDVVQSEEEKAEYVRNRSLVEIQLETGRHHQIRVQMAHAGYPLAGDKKYNPGCQSGYLPIGLCSVRLAFVHPVTGKRMEFSIEPTGEAFCSFC